MRARELSALIDATWPAASIRDVQGWTIREGRGAGNRVSAATASEPGNDADRAHAVKAMRAIGQHPVFMVRSGEEHLDAALAAEGYDIVTPTIAYVAPIAEIAGNGGPAETVWPPSEAERGIWAEGGIGAARLAVMERVVVPRTACTVREDGLPVATGFAALHGRTCVLHAIETLIVHRRRGHGRRVIGELSRWGAAQGAEEVALLVVETNTSANALYRAMGFTPAAGYHYRTAPEVE